MVSVIRAIRCWNKTKPPFILADKERHNISNTLKLWCCKDTIKKRDYKTASPFSVVFCLTSDCTDSTDFFCHLMNRMNQIIFLLPTDNTNNTNFLRSFVSSVVFIFNNEPHEFHEWLVSLVLFVVYFLTSDFTDSTDFSFSFSFSFSLSSVGNET